MSAPVDVLAVLARHASLADQVACREQQAEAHAVFDAVGELIQHNAVMRAALSACPCFCQDEDEDGDAATCDRCAALARVGGGK